MHPHKGWSRLPRLAFAFPLTSNCEFSCFCWKSVVTLPLFLAPKPTEGGVGVRAYYIGKALLDALFLTLRNLAVLDNRHKQSNKDAHWICCIHRSRTSIIRDSCASWWLFIYISAWASALLVLTIEQCQSFEEWDEQQGRFPRFFCIVVIPIFYE